MADRTDAAEPLHGDRHLPVGPALDESLEAAKLDDVQPRLLHVIVFVEQNADLAVSFDAGDRLNHNATRIIASRYHCGRLQLFAVPASRFAVRIVRCA